MPVIEIPPLRLIAKAKRKAEAELHPEVLRCVGNAYRDLLGDHFKSEMGFYPDEMQASQALACALGEAIQALAEEGHDIIATRNQMVSLVDEVVTAAVKGFMLGERRDE